MVRGRGVFAVAHQAVLPLMPHLQIILLTLRVLLVSRFGMLRCTWWLGQDTLWCVVQCIAMTVMLGGWGGGRINDKRADLYVEGIWREDYMHRTSG